MASPVSRDGDGKPQDPVIQAIPDTEIGTHVNVNVEQPTAPDQFEERHRTTRSEIWAYYACVLFESHRTPC